ncbi:MAG: hypothetical protein K0S58_2469, partial [Nitrospira sp.]|nr:hypothetical protein [Nitrospira sp.]
MDLRTEPHTLFPVYTTNRLPRRKPTSVKLNSQASCAVRLEAAETQATMGTPATRAFWMISKDPRPLMNIS